MRLTIPLLKKHARVPQNESKVPFKEVYPLRLQNRASGRIRSEQGKTCMYEMTLLFSCLKEYDFQDNQCNEHIQNFQNCVTNYKADKRRQKALQQIGIPMPGATNFTETQISYLLRKYPNV